MGPSRPPWSYYGTLEFTALVEEATLSCWKRSAAPPETVVVNGHGPAEKKLETAPRCRRGLPCPTGTCRSFRPAVFFLLCWVETRPFSPLACGEAENFRIAKTLQPTQARCLFFKPWGKGGPKRKTHTARERGARGHRSLSHVRICPLFHGSGVTR